MDPASRFLTRCAAVPARPPARELLSSETGIQTSHWPHDCERHTQPVQGGQRRPRRSSQWCSGISHYQLLQRDPTAATTVRPLASQALTSDLLTTGAASEAHGRSLACSVPAAAAVSAFTLEGEPLLQHEHQPGPWIRPCYAIARGPGDHKCAKLTNEGEQSRDGRPLRNQLLECIRLSKDFCRAFDVQT